MQYRICWNNDNTTLDMLVQARTPLGWIAWGIGDQKGGGMLGGADIIQVRLLLFVLWFRLLIRVSGLHDKCRHEDYRFVEHKHGECSSA